MFIRYFLLLCIVATYAAALQNSLEDSEHINIADDEERAALAVTVVAKLIGSLFTGAAVSCVTEAATNCKQYWKNPSAALGCARNFLKINKGRCAIGG